eukprot:c11483_g1_i1.p1 GENE.c11483_g1_i1~~c11483_g1_i1.p1  ORF type:complete len:945 (-),score=279.74 c11483_g1_i1:356-3190(-)
MSQLIGDDSSLELGAVVDVPISNDGDERPLDDSSLKLPPAPHSRKRKGLTLLGEAGTLKGKQGWKQYIPSSRDVLAAVIGYVYALAMVMVSAGTLFNSNRLRPYLGSMVYMYVLGCAVAGFILIFTSKLGYPIPNPDPFPIPFLLAMVVSVEHDMKDESDEALFMNCIFVIFLCKIAIGIILLLSSVFRLMRLSDFIPYPVVCGLLAGQGALLVEICLKLTYSGEQPILKVFLTMIFGLVFVTARKTKPMFSIPALFVVVTSIFYGSLLGNGRTVDSAIADRWLFSRDAVAKSKIITAFNLDYSLLNGKAIINVVPNILALLILFIIKTVLIYPGFEKLINVKVKLDNELTAIGWACLGAGLVGGAPSTLGPTVIFLIYCISPTKHLPSIMGNILYAFGFIIQKCSYITYIPIFMLSGLLFANGYSLLDAWLAKPYKKLPFGEWFIVFLIVGVSLFFNLLTAIFFGAGVSVILFATSTSSVSCVKLIVSGQTMRSTVDRTAQHKDFLDEKGDAIQVLQLQGYIFFGHGSSMINQIKDIKKHVTAFGGHPEPDKPKKPKRGIPKQFLDAALKVTNAANLKKDSVPATTPSRRESDSGGSRLTIAELATGNAHASADTKAVAVATAPAGPPTDQKTFVVFDMPFVLGIDTSAVDMFEQIFRLVGKSCTVCFSGCHPHVKKIIELRKDIFYNVKIYDDLDTALETCEEELLAPLLDSERTKAAKLFEAGDTDAHTGFDKCLAKIGERYSIDITLLKELRSYVHPIRLEVGDVLMKQQKGTAVDIKKDSLFFIESGSIRIDRDMEQSLTPRRDVDEKTYRSQQRMQNRNFRLTRLGPGWIVGAQELLSGYRSIGLFRAETVSIVHYLPFSSIKVIESHNPALGFELHYLLGKVITESSDRDKEQLSNLMDMIFTFPVASKAFSFGLKTKKPKTPKALLYLGQLKDKFL